MGFLFGGAVGEKGEGGAVGDDAVSAVGNLVSFFFFLSLGGIGGSDLVASGRHMGEEGIGLARGAHSNTRASPFSVLHSPYPSTFLFWGAGLVLFHWFLLTYSSSLQASQERERDQALCH